MSVVGKDVRTLRTGRLRAAWGLAPAMPSLLLLDAYMDELTPKPPLDPTGPATDAAGHVPVLRDETLALLALAPGMRAVDGTFGGGGHTRAMLAAVAPHGHVLALDADPDAALRAEPLRREYGDRFTLRTANFAAMAAEAAAIGWGPGSTDAVLLDLGLSSFQLADAARGFSFQSDGPLDMRFGPAAPFTAADIVNTWDEAALADLFWNGGEEPAARRVAREIVRRREAQPFTRTLAFAEAVSAAKGGRRGRIHPATQVFQALRIAANDELGVLERALAAGRDLLRPGGRFAVIAFHSLEDRAVKRFFRAEASDTEPDTLPRNLPVAPAPRTPTLRVLTRKPTMPGAAEIARNPRSRSAVLRVAEKLAPPASPPTATGKAGA